MQTGQPVPDADGGTYELSIWFQTPDELEAGIRALGAHPSFVQWYRNDFDAWPEVECRLESMFRDDQPAERSAWRGLCSLARLRTGKRIGAWLNVWNISEDSDYGDPPYRTLVESFEYPVAIGLYVFPYAPEYVSSWTELDEWFVDVARSVYRCVPFRVAAIDQQLSDSYEEALSRSDGVLRQEDGELRWYPPTGDPYDL